MQVTGTKTFVNVSTIAPVVVDKEVVIPRTPEDLRIEMSEFCDSFVRNVNTTVDYLEISGRYWMNDLANAYYKAACALNLYWGKTFFFAGDVTFAKNVVVKGTFNGENVLTLDTTFWLSNMNNTISSVTGMSSANIPGPSVVEVKVNMI